MNRAELEDGFLRLHDENLVLKEFACKQEDRIKRYQQGPMKPITLTIRILGSQRHGGAEEGMQGLQREHVAAIRGNVELIRLQRLLGERSCELAVTRGRFTDLQENQEMLRTSSEALLAQVEELTVQLKAETQKVLALESKVESISFLQGALEEFQERIRSLEKERDLLKEDYDKLLERGWAGPHHDKCCGLCWEDKGGLVWDHASQRARGSCSLGDCGAPPSFSRVGVALSCSLLAHLLPVSLQPPCLDRLPTETEQEALFTQRSLSRRRHETEAAHADTILELEKTRDMLILQHRINRDYQAELKGVMVQAEQEKRGHEEKQQKMAQLLDLRSTRIRQLEGKSREAGEPALESSSDAQTTDSDEIVVGTSLGSPPKDVERIHIEIVSLSLHPEAEAMASEHIQQLYVEYHFPGVPLTETPLSLRKPQGGEEIYFHFSKVIQLDPEGVSSQREILFSMLQAEEAGLQFVVVSEPLPGTGGECEDVGFAYIDLREILLTGNDVLEHDLDVVSPQDRSAIGRLKVSVEAAAALCAIYWEGRRKLPQGMQGLGTVRFKGGPPPTSKLTGEGCHPA
uniref:RPGR interacting protein 1 n=1 Tax=Chrysemys picta bellii TaxID=8478 RepID=A0A8C3FY14_CHRPI